VRPVTRAGRARIPRRALLAAPLPCKHGASFTEEASMRKSSLAALAVLLLPALAAAVGPTALFTLPPEGTTPSTFGSLPFPNDLYFDQGRPENGDGTLLNSGASIGLGTSVIETNTASVEQAIDLMDGFGTTTAVYFFFSGALDALPAT